MATRTQQPTTQDGHPETNSSFLSRWFFLWILPVFENERKRARENDKLQDEDLLGLPENLQSQFLMSGFYASWRGQVEKHEAKAKLTAGHASDSNTVPLLLAAGDAATDEEAVELRKQKQANQMRRAGWMLLWSIHAALKKDFTISCMISIVLVGVSISFPIALNLILTSIEHLDPANLSPAIGLSVLLGVVALMRTILQQHYYFHMYRMYPGIKACITGSVFDKALRLSTAERGGLNDGQISNYQSTDGDAIAYSFLSMFDMAQSMVQLIAYMVMLYSFIGWAAFAGLAVMASATPLTAKIGQVMFYQFDITNALRDERVKRVNEILQGMLGVKMAAWEERLSIEVGKIRTKELTSVWWQNFSEVASDALFEFLPVLTAAVSITTYGYFNQGDLKASTVFTALSIFELLKVPIAQIPQAYAAMAKGALSFRRVGSFLGREEVAEDDDHQQQVLGGNSAIGISNATFYWADPEALTRAQLENDDDVVETKPTGSKRAWWRCCGVAGSVAADQVQGAKQEEEEDSSSLTTPPVLSNISCTVKRGSLTAVIGPVGSGKSSLCNAILGELHRTSGSVQVYGTVAYAAQTPWILNATVRDNIVFGQPYDADRYNAVLKACELETDLVALSAGDQTEIGEKGVNISGGQQARVSIARAAYSHAQIVILDDPLSALDPGVSAKVFNNCINGLMKGKTVLLVTNQLNFLPKCDWIVVLSAVEDANLATASAVDDDEEEGDEDDGFADEADGSSESQGGSGSDSNADAATDAKEKQKQKKKKTTSCGYIAEQGTYEELNTAGQNFSRLLRRFNKMHSKSKRQVSTGSNAGVNSKEPLNKDGLIDGEVESQDDKEKDKLIEDEERNTGSVGWKLYRDYFASGNSWVFLLFILGSVGLQLVVVFGAQWVAFWTEDAGNDYAYYYSHHHHHLDSDNQALVDDYSEDYQDQDQELYSYQDDDNEGVAVMRLLGNLITNNHTHNGTLGDVTEPLLYYSGVYVGLALVALVSIVLTELTLLQFMMKSSTKAHENLLASVMRTPMSFLDTTPVGRILSRFATDTERLDTETGFYWNWFVWCVLATINTLVVVAYSTPYFLGALPFIAIVYLRLAKRFRPVNRELKRMQSVSRSPIFAHFSEALNGLSTIRAYARQQEFIESIAKRIDVNTEHGYNLRMSERWLGAHLGLVASTIVVLAGIFAVQAVNAGTLTAGQAGMSLSFSITVSSALSSTVRAFTNVEQQMNSFERVQHYTTGIKHEAARESKNPPAAAWPQEGRLVVTNLKMRYRPDTPLVLKGISFTVEGGQRVGVVGRTGSGKSSLMLCLLRLVEPERTSDETCAPIVLDGVDTCSLGLKELRRKISIVPQSPVIFSGTVRSNLDMFNDYTDAELWNALEKTDLKALVSSYPEKLMHPVSEYGDNFSQGQRQLLCLARALLEKNKVLLLDEATSSVDFETDELIQRTIRAPDSFGGCTVITIAHRINTVIDNDKILVLDAGQVAEYDAPATLLADKTSKLSSMVQHS